MATVANAKVDFFAAAPLARWRKKNLIQGMAYARSPKTKQEYLFIAQAQTGGPADVEDALYHRYEIIGRQLVYKDTMIGRRFGHPQNFHVRISIHDKPWIWGSIEQYAFSRKVGVKVARFPYQGGKVMTSSNKGFSYIDTGRGTTTAVISSPEWKIVLRRAKALTEIYEEHDEKLLLAGINKPVRKFTRLKTRGGVYQSAVATKHAVFVTTGATETKHRIYQHNWESKCAGIKDVTNVKAPVGPNTSSEPEGLTIIRGVLHLSKRFNSPEKRVCGIFGLRW